jgi:hypothetical protein
MLGTSVLAFCVWVGALTATLSLIVFVVGAAALRHRRSPDLLALLPLALLLNRGLVAAHAALAARILGPSEDQRRVLAVLAWTEAP